MAKNNNLTDFLTDLANTLRTENGTSELINPQDFSSTITSMLDTTETNAIIDSLDNGVGVYAPRTSILYNNNTGAEIEAALSLIRETDDDVYIYVNGVMAGSLTGTHDISAHNIQIIIPEGVGKIKIIGGTFTFNSYILGSESNNEIVTEVSLGGNYGTEIGVSTFDHCTQITQITIPSTITDIKLSAFEGCTALTRVDITNLTSWFNILFAGDYSNPLKYGHDLYINGEKLTDLVVPNTITEIKRYAFSGCSLTSVTIPSSITRIDIYSFGDCDNLTRVNASSIEEWNSISFAGSTSQPSNPLYWAKHLYINDQEVIDLIIPNTITTIKSYVFHGCTGIKSVTIPSTVKNIGPYAFESSGITKVYSPSIEDWFNIVFSSNANPLTVAHHLYINGSEVTSITIPSSTTSIRASALEGASYITNITTHNSITTIGYRAFMGCSKLTTITIPTGISALNEEVFRDCAVLNNITIPSNIRLIANNAFYGCKGLTTIDIPASVTDMRYGAFQGCTGLMTAYLRFTSTTTKCNTKPSFIGSNRPWFYGCSSSLKLYIKSSVTNPTNTFGTYWRYRSTSAQLTYYSTL